MFRNKFCYKIIVVIVFGVFIFPNLSFAAMSSSNYSVVSDSLNDGGISSSSANFQVGGVLGSAVSGTASSTNFRASDGFAATLLSNTPVPSGGTSGSGGGSIYFPSVVFSGLTSPKALVQIYIDNVLVGSSYANSSGSFAISVSRDGAYTATILSTDTNGRTVSVIRDKNLSASAVVSGILFSPSISSTPVVVTVGDKIIVTGSAMPGSILSVVLKPPSSGRSILHVVVPGIDGAWQTVFDTAGFAEGVFSIEATASFLGASATSTLSDSITKAAPAPVKSCSLKGDFNCDGKVNLQDVSILIAFFKKKTFPINYDLNADGKINLVDFSILLYYWKK